MARPADDLTALVALLRTLGDDDYAALASVGLVRRAHKELATARVVGWADGQAVVEVGAQTVRIPATGPARARCSCPSPGVCQHTIAACLALVAQARPDETPGSVPSDPVVAGKATDGEPASAASTGSTPTGLAATPPDLGVAAQVVSPDAWPVVEASLLRRWAGADAWRQAVELAASAQVERRPRGAAIVRFADGVEARLPPGAHLDALITNAPARLRRRVLAAAVLAARGAGDWPLAVNATDAWRLPVELLRAVESQLCECLRLGLNRFTPSTLARLEVLGVQCRAAGVYRVALELESCATECRLILDRDAQADPERLLDRVAQLFALAEALLVAERPDPALVGSARSDYEERATLALVGCGAYRWLTPSGFHGLTVLLWDGEAAQFLSWSDSRPVGSGDGFTPAKRYRDEAPWAGSVPVERLSGSSFELERPRVSGQRRLSGSATSRVGRVAAPVADDLPPAATHWQVLRATVVSSSALGLRRLLPLDLVVRLQPSRIHPPRFDEIAQALVWTLEDAAGDLLDAVVPFTPENANAIQVIEKRPPKPGDSLIGYLRPGTPETFFPVARVAGGDRLQIESLAFLQLDAEPASWWQRLFARGRSGESAWTPPTGEVESVGDGAEVTPLRQLLAPARNGLLGAAETGIAAHPTPEEWEGICGSLAAAGLVALSRSLVTAFASPRALLRGAYLTSMYWQAG